MISRYCKKWNGILAACSAAAVLLVAAPATAATYTLKGATGTNDTTALGKVGSPPVNVTSIGLKWAAILPNSAISDAFASAGVFQ